MIKLLAFLFLVVNSAHAAEGVEVTATVDRNQVGMGDVFNLQLTVSAKESVTVEEPQIPSIRGMELIGSSTGSETRSSYVNGRFLTEQARTFNYMIAAQLQGKLTIPALTVNVDGKAYQTKPIDIAVSARAQVQPRAGQQPPRGRGGAPDPFGMLDEQDEELFRQMLQRNFPGGGGGGIQPQQPVNPNEAFFVQTEVDKPRAYVGEQVTAAFYLYTRGQIRDIDTLKYPDLKGFWKEELEMATRLNFEQVVVNGIPYQRALLVSYALFPIKAGKATIDSYKAKCTVLTPSTFGFGRPYQFTKASREVAIEVKDVPTEGRPANFTGAVGRFRVTAAFEPPTGTTNTPITLRIRFEGQGNAKLIELPNLNLPPSFELYDQKSQAKFLKDGTSFKEFEVLIIPHEPGVFKIPPVAMGVFDPESAKFQNIASQPLNLTVTGTATSPQANVPSAPEKRDTADRGPKLPLPAIEMGSTVASAQTMMGITAGVYLGLFGFLGLTAVRQLRRKPKKASLKMILARRSKNVRDLAAKGEYRRVGVEMTNAAYYLLGQLSDQGGANLELERLLEKTPPSLRRELAEPIAKLLAQCEALSFAPESMIAGMTEKSKLQGLISEFEKILARAIELSEI
jgi:hypothetical protein